MRKLSLPLDEMTVRGLELGEPVALDGLIYTARDAAHRFLAGPGGDGLGAMLRGGVIYHCGPVMVKDGGAWRVTAAGPTPSMREEPYMAGIIARYGIRAVIGKGGMGARTAEALMAHGCVYLHAVGGAAQVLASCVKSVPSVSMYEEFGAPEAVWCLEVRDFPAIVTMDCKGRSLHRTVLENSGRRLAELLGTGL